MRQMFKAITLVLAAGILLVGCQSDPGPLTFDQGNPGLASQLMLPPGATLESATFYIHVNQVSGETVNVHRVTADWMENTVTWNNFGASFDGTVVGSFVADAIDWRSVEITGLVSDWLNGTYPNHGILLDQVDMVFPRSRYDSREAGANQPYIEVCYTTVEGVFTCQMEVALADAYIWEIAPDNNFGDRLVLYTGWQFETDLEKQSLLKFDLEFEPQGGCSHTIGYWKTHAGIGPQDPPDDVTPHLPIWLGDEGGDKSLEVTSAAMAVDVLVMKTYGKNNNGITKLYAQLLGAKLSILSGAADTDVADIIADADAFLADHDFTDWDSLSDAENDMVMDWQEDLDLYNNGFIGPGHCDEFELDD